jgi:hypothetical protein
MNDVDGITNHYEQDLLPDFLKNCQYVEEKLKAVILEYHKIVHKCVDGKIVYKYNEEAISEASMDTLIKWLRPFTDDQELITNLAELKKQRNILAHRGYTAFQKLEKDYSVLEKWVDDTSTANSVACKCLSNLVLLHENIKKI